MLVSWIRVHMHNRCLLDPSHTPKVPSQNSKAALATSISTIAGLKRVSIGSACATIALTPDLGVILPQMIKCTAHLMRDWSFVCELCSGQAFHNIPKSVSDGHWLLLVEGTTFSSALHLLITRDCLAPLHPSPSHAISRLPFFLWCLIGSRAPKLRRVTEGLALALLPTRPKETVGLLPLLTNTLHLHRPPT